MQNQDVMIFGPRLCLVPYLRHHVPKYHEWMCDPALLASTCSEPLSLEEEYENQASWLASNDKLTFILLAPCDEAEASGGAVATCGGVLPVGGTSSTTSADNASDVHPSASRRRRYAMIGDCNLFVPPNHEEDGVEVEVMVAEETFRRRGFAAEAVRLLMSYAVRELGFRHFIAKILSSNEASIRLFTDVLGFTRWKEVKVFSEVHFEHRVVEGWRTTVDTAEAAAVFDSSNGSVSEKGAVVVDDCDVEAEQRTRCEGALPWERQCPYSKLCYTNSIASIVVDGLDP